MVERLGSLEICYLLRFQGKNIPKIKKWEGLKKMDKAEKN